MKKKYSNYLELPSNGKRSPTAFAKPETEAEKSDLEKIFELKKEEIKQNEQFVELRKNLRLKIDQIEKNEADFSKKYRENVTNMEAREIPMIERLQQQ